MWREIPLAKKLVSAVFAILGILGVLAGALYFAEPSKSLPSFFPGHSATSTLHGDKHGAAAVAAGVVLFVIAVIVALSSRNTYE
jgi:hypothetical protein